MKKSSALFTLLILVAFQSRAEYKNTQTNAKTTIQRDSERLNLEDISYMLKTIENPQQYSDNWEPTTSSHDEKGRYLNHESRSYLYNHAIVKYKYHVKNLQNLHKINPDLVPEYKQRHMEKLIQSMCTTLHTYDWRILEDEDPELTEKIKKSEMTLIKECIRKHME